MNENENEFSVLNAIKQRMGDLKKTVTYGKEVTANSSWLDIILQLSNYDDFKQNLVNSGRFTDEESAYLQSLPAYKDIISANPISDANVYIQKFMEEIPIVVYTIETEKKELQNLDILVYNDYPYPMFTIINYRKEVSILNSVPQRRGYNCHIVAVIYDPKGYMPF